MKRKHEENTLFEGTPVQFSRSALNQRFILPPFSVLSARDGEWQKRKNLWLSLGIKSEVGREKDLMGTGYRGIQHKYQGKIGADDSVLAQSTSVFDPVLCELCYTWFCPPGGKILDPFAGGSVRGIVAAVLGFDYSGCDLRQDQVAANIAQGDLLLNGDAKPKWVAGDSVEIQTHLPGEYDYVFSCPPYGDLEVYSDDASDISNMDRDAFMVAYKAIIKNACAMLKDDSFACFVVGDYRGKDGNFANFPAVTTEAFKEAGLAYYNEAILVTAVGSLPIRVSYQFPISRKLGRTHQNVLVYCKGDPFRASAKIAGREMPTLKVRNISQRPAAALPPVAWTPPESFPNLQGCKRIAVDVETCDPDLKKMGPGTRRGAYMVGFSISTDQGFKGYYPLRHEGGGNVDPERVLGWARDALPQYRGEVVGHNLMYDLDFLANENILFNADVKYRDTMIAAPLLDEHRFSYALEVLAQEYLGRGKSDVLLNQAAAVAGYKDVKSNLWRLPGAYVGAYGEDDTSLPLELLALQEAQLEQAGLTELFHLECALTPMLLAMRRNGVRVNISRAEKVREELAIRRDAAVAEFRRLLGRQKAEIMAMASFADALKDRGLKMQYTEKGAISIRKAWLEANKNDPAIAALLLARRLDKTINTFLDGHILGHQVNGRIHTQFHQLKGEDGGTIGRFSSSMPNLQQIPARDEELAPLVRAIFEPEEGNDWERMDESQIEVRLEAHYAVGPRAEEFRQTYIANPRTDYHKMTAEWIGVDPEDKYKRKMVKGTNFAKKYGAMAPKLAQIMGCSIDEAKDFVRKYEAALPWTKATFEKCQNLAAARGYVRTLLGRYARFPLWEPASNARRKFEERVPPYPRDRAETEYPGQHLVRANTYTAMNNVLQLGSADIMKKAMVDIWEGGVCNYITPLLTVHDELDFDKPRTREAAQASEEAKRIMEQCIPLKVPLIVDRDVGPNWGACG